MRKFMTRLALTTTVALVILLHTMAVLAQGPIDQQPDLTIDASVRTQVIEALLKRIREAYVFPDVAQKMDAAIRERMKNKEYDQITSAATFARTLTEHLQAVSHDKHLRVRYSAEAIPVREERKEPSADERENFRRFANRINHGFEKVERLRGNIGYLDFRGFFDPELGAETVAAAMTFVANTDALIIDLRQNGGGDPAMVALISSYLFGNDPVHLNDLYWREGNRTEQFWTKPNVPGKRFEGKDVYILTSNRTFSGAEEFSYNLKNLKRATIVGETTGGGAHPGEGARLSEHFGMFIPMGRAINPITKTNWEGTGVKPDVEVASDLALKTAYLMALNKARDKAPDDRARDDYKRLIEETQKELDSLKKSPTAKAGS